VYEALRIRQHTSAYVSIRYMSQATQATQVCRAYVSMRQHTSAYVSIRQHTSAYVSIRYMSQATQATQVCRAGACSALKLLVVDLNY
jgi:hypothetical protein